MSEQLQFQIEYPLEYHLLKLKFQVDQFWVDYSVYCLPFVFAIWCYKVIKPKEFKSVDEYKKFKRPLEDKILPFFVFFAPIYYLIDSILLTYTGLSFLSGCRFFILLHHIASILFLPLLLFSKYVPWWQNTPAWFHSLLLMYPQYGFLNYPYAITLFIAHFGFYRKVYRELTMYKLLQGGVLFGYLSQFLLLIYACDNSGRDYSYLYDPNHKENLLLQKYYPNYLYNTNATLHQDL